jgi:hypothetical protein
VLLGPRRSVNGDFLPDHIGDIGKPIFYLISRDRPSSAGSAKVVTDAGTDLAHVRREDRGVRKDLSLRGWAAIREHG